VSSVSRSSVQYRVPFADTDGMGIVYHGHYLRYLEIARIAWMDEHDRPYREVVAEGFHFATTRVDVEYLRPAVFDDILVVSTWIDWVRGASLAMAYEITRAGERIARAHTEHAFVALGGRPRPLSREHRQRLAELAARDAPAGRRARGRADPSR
jgi:acyl-CoA thioester hydrolase